MYGFGAISPVWLMGERRSLATLTDM